MTQTTVKKSKKKKNRRLTPVMKLVCIVLIGISIYLLYSVGREVMTTLELRRQLAEVEEKLEKVQLENERLNKEKEKLQDPDYVQSYARGNYMLSKDGEQIFYLPESNSGD
ncbi:MAG: septum formation initiator family protein [Erysipelotrichaceae bacterium]|jgi:cell division protein DivIC|nr:septum formation initiator family protein [Erysipelotrichaceae bacterium]MDO5109794.1 septum formation initiator family protein [Erysipelotrichaceae bacterium]